MYARAICKKCHCVGHIDIEELPKDKVINFLRKADFGECPFGGYHVELGKLSDYIYTDLSLPLTSTESIYPYENMPDVKFGTYIKMQTSHGIRIGYFLQLEKLKDIKYNSILFLNELNKVERMPLSVVTSINQYKL